MHFLATGAEEACCATAADKAQDICLWKRYFSSRTMLGDSSSVKVIKDLIGETMPGGANVRPVSDILRYMR